MKAIGPGIHAGALRHARVFGVLDHAQAHARRGGQGFAHDAVFQNRMAVVGHRDGAGGFERGKIVERFALRSARGRGDGEDAHTARRAPGPCIQRVISGESLTGDGIGHGGHGGESSRCRGCGAGGDGLFVALARLAQMHVNVDEARRNSQAGRIEDFGAIGGFQLAGGGDFGDAAVFEQNVFEDRRCRRLDR